MSSWKFNGKIILIFWIGFTFSIGVLRCTKIDFFMVSTIMLCLLQIYNVVQPIEMSIRNIILQSFVPSIIFWYIIYKCNNFLWIYPFDEITIISISLIYFYILIYILIEFK